MHTSSATLFHAFSFTLKSIDPRLYLPQALKLPHCFYNSFVLCHSALELYTVPLVSQNQVIFSSNLIGWTLGSATLATLEKNSRLLQRHSPLVMLTDARLVQNMTLTTFATLRWCERHIMNQALHMFSGTKVKC